MKIGILKFVSIQVMIVIILAMTVSCGHKERIPKDKEAIIGVWQSPSGFQMEILPEGFVNVYQPIDSKNPEYQKLCVLKGNAVYNFAYKLEFISDSVFQIIKPYNNRKQYHLNRKPFFDGDTLKMIVNDVTLSKFNEDNFLSDM